MSVASLVDQIVAKRRDAIHQTIAPLETDRPRLMQMGERAIEAGLNRMLEGDVVCVSICFHVDVDDVATDQVDILVPARVGMVFAHLVSKYKDVLSFRTESPGFQDRVAIDDTLTLKDAVDAPDDWYVDAYTGELFHGVAVIMRVSDSKMVEINRV